LLVCALVPIGALTGCGSGGTSTTKSTTATHASPAASLSASLHKATASCLKVLGSSPYVPVSQRAAAKRACEGVKTGNIAAVARLRTILKQACERAVIAKIPTADKPTALTACKKVY
ncbi:MAG TPA: hypothetical protein VIJ20_07990, partial [Solirubrobacteraceae bacterium]